MGISAPPTPPQQARTRRAALAVGTFLLWTLFVWGGRIRNALGDPELDDGGRTGPLLLSVSFVVPSVVLVVAVIVAQRRRRSLAPAASAPSRRTGGPDRAPRARRSPRPVEQIGGLTTSQARRS